MEPKVDYKIGLPVNFDSKEIDSFVMLLRKQRQVENPNATKVNTSSFLCIVYSNNVPVGIGAIKQVYKTPFDKAGVPELKSKYDFELGYIFLDTESNLRGLGIGKNIAKKLLEKVDHKNVFATTENSNNNKMLMILKELGFVATGTVYKGENTGKEIVLMLREANK